LFKRNQELFARRVVAPQDLDTARANAEATGVVGKPSDAS
jgi:hypothetical protein